MDSSFKPYDVARSGVDNVPSAFVGDHSRCLGNVDGDFSIRQSSVSYDLYLFRLNFIICLSNLSSIYVSLQVYDGRVITISLVLDGYFIDKALLEKQNWFIYNDYYCVTIKAVVGIAVFVVPFIIIIIHLRDILSVYDSIKERINGFLDPGINRDFRVKVVMVILFRKHFSSNCNPLDLANIDPCNYRGLISAINSLCLSSTYYSDDSYFIYVFIHNNCNSLIRVTC